MISLIKKARHQTKLIPLKKVTISLSLALLSTYATFLLCYSISEKYFFDKIFYQKSIKHGYWKKEMSFEDFGPRVDNLITLNKYSDSKQILKNKTSVNQPTKNHQLTILLIGDSYFFGQGLREKQAVASILEKKLNQDPKTYPAQVINLSMSGDSIFDHYAKYDIAKNIWNPDFIIFGLTHNDLLWNSRFRYKHPIYRQILSQCSNKELIKNFIIQNDKQFMKMNETEAKSISASSLNYCGFKLLINKLPTRNTTYIYLDSPAQPNHPFNKIIKDLEKHQFCKFKIESAHFTSRGKICGCQNITQN